MNRVLEQLRLRTDIGRVRAERFYFQTVYEAQYLRPRASTWQRLGTYDNRRDAERALFLAYDRGQIPAGSELRVVEGRRVSTPPPEMVTRYFIVYRPPGGDQREMGPYRTRDQAERALFLAVERGRIPRGSSATIQEREVPAH